MLPSQLNNMIKQVKKLLTNMILKYDLVIKKNAFIL